MSARCNTIRRLIPAERLYRIGSQAVVALAIAACGPSGPSSNESVQLDRVVTEGRVSRAMASERPERLTMTDEIEFFSSRLAAAGPGEHGWSHRRLASAHLLRFRAYGGRDDLAKAQWHIAALEVLEPDAPDVLSLRSSIQLLEHDFTGSLDAARRANREIGDFDSALRLRLFDALWATGEYESAKHLLDLPHDTTGFDYLVREARLLDRLGHTEAARDNLLAALDQAKAYAEPSAVIAWTLIELGHFELHSGNAEVAVERYLQSLEVLPGSPAALEGLGRVAAGVDRNYEAAELLFARAIRNGAHLDLYLEFASAAEARGDLHEARLSRARFLERASVKGRIEREYLRPAALLLADHEPDRLPEALAHAELDLAQRPTLESWDTLAWVHYRMGDLSGALAASKKATAWGVSEPTVLYHAGIIADAAGKDERAVELLEAALDASTELSLDQVAEIERLLDL